MLWNGVDDRMKPKAKKETRTEISLSKGIFGIETDPTKTPFGFISGQIRINGLLNNAGWFNSRGEKLGYGDLSLDDLKTVSKQIPSKELFFVLSEFDTAWDIPKELDKQAPGIDYVMKHCLWVVYSGEIFKVRDAIKASKTADYEAISRKDFYIKVGYNTKQVLAPEPPQDAAKMKEDDVAALLAKAQKIINQYQPTPPLANTPTNPSVAASSPQQVNPPGLTNLPAPAIKKKIKKTITPTIP